LDAVIHFAWSKSKHCEQARRPTCKVRWQPRPKCAAQGLASSSVCVPRTNCRRLYQRIHLLANSPALSSQAARMAGWALTSHEAYCGIAFVVNDMSTLLHCNAWSSLLWSNRMRPVSPRNLIVRLHGVTQSIHAAHTTLDARLLCTSMHAPSTPVDAPTVEFSHVFPNPHGRGLLGEGEGRGSLSTSKATAYWMSELGSLD